MGTAFTGVAGIGLGVLVFVILVGGGMLFQHIAEVNAADTEDALACQELRVAIEQGDGRVAVINRGGHTVSGMLTVERAGRPINTTRVRSLLPGELVWIPVPEADTAVFKPDSCDRTFTATLD